MYQGPIIDAIVNAIAEPYNNLLKTLRADGRVTAEEIETLQAQLRDRWERLTDLVVEELRESRPPDPPSDGP